MRVIAGTLRGRRLDAPSSRDVRPTYDRVRESIFAIMEPSLRGASVLDAFAGSGSLAIESISRGAEHATLLERDPAVARVAAGNIERLGLESVCALRRGDALRLMRESLPGAPFDIVFVDPPYASGLQERVMLALGNWGGLAEGALVVLERAAGRGAGPSFGRLGIRRTERYGSTEVDFYYAGVGETRTDLPG